MAQDPRILEHRRGVLASIACLQADPVQVVEIAIPEGPNTGLRHMPKPTLVLSHLPGTPKASPGPGPERLSATRGRPTRSSANSQQIRSNYAACAPNRIATRAVQMCVRQDRRNTS